MFFTDVYGPHSTDEFNAVFVERLQPQLAAEQVIAAGWFDASGYVIAGYASFDPSDLVVRLLGSGGWDGKTRFFTGLPGHRAGLPTTMPTFATCDLPFNQHGIVGTTYRKCPQGHTFDDHALTLCPVCGGIL